MNQKLMTMYEKGMITTMEFAVRLHEELKDLPKEVRTELARQLTMENARTFHMGSFVK